MRAAASGVTTDRGWRHVTSLPFPAVGPRKLPTAPHANAALPDSTGRALRSGVRLVQDPPHDRPDEHREPEDGAQATDSLATVLPTLQMPPGYLLPLARLCVTHSMVRFERSVAPPLDQAVTWSASISFCL